MAAASFGQPYTIGAADGSSWRKIDLLEAILAQDPRNTPFYEVTGEGTAKAELHQWQARGLKARASNKKVHGAKLVGAELTPPTRYKNVCQNLHTGISATGTTMDEMHYGVNDVWTDAVDKAMTEHRNDEEWNLIRMQSETASDNPATAEGTVGAAGVAPEMSGLLTVMKAIGANSGSDAWDQSGAILTETLFLDLLSQLRQKVDAPRVDCMTGINQRKIIDKFDGFGSFASRQEVVRSITHTVQEYVSSFGTVQIHLSLDLLNGSNEDELVMFDRRQLKKAYLRNPTLYPIAKTHDADEATIISRLTLEYGNPEVVIGYANLDSDGVA